jgi:hypothetical protein
VIRPIDFYDELAKWTAIKVTKASGGASKLYLASMIGESRWFSTNASNSSISLREPRLTP